MAYYCGSCSGCGNSYSISMPQNEFNYIPSSSGISYSLANAAVPASYAFSSGDVQENYKGSVDNVDTRIISNSEKDNDKVRIIPQENIQIINPEEPIRNFRLEEIPPIEFNAKPELKKLIPKDEIERAIQKIKQVEQIEIQEEIVIRRKIRSKTIRFKDEF
ncbi:hypothetical protein JXB41_01945 [Candidatus Woesearchaeota archaeon]|nr:hypothetical protein [Candidatus Woesearchaeota archaeon]